jgi:DNA-directed RNA polymerase alpha subunit
MTGSTYHIGVPADDPDLLESLAEVLETHPSAPDPRYATRMRAAAASRRANAGPKALTAESPIEDLLEWGIEKIAVNLLGREGEISTIGELCERDADTLLDIKSLGDKRLKAIVAVLAQHYMGLRPRRRPAG